MLMTDSGGCSAHKLERRMACRLRRMTHRDGGEAGTAGTQRAIPGRVHGATGDEARKDGTGTGVK